MKYPTRPRRRTSARALVTSALPPLLAALGAVGLAFGCGGAPGEATGESEQDVATTGLLGQYYDNADLTNLKLSRVDPTVNFSWGSGSPAAGVGSDSFSVRWTGKITPKTTETYKFAVTSDDGVRLWVNGKLVVDDWTLHSARTDYGSIALTAGTAYDIKLEYFDNAYSSVVKLAWSTPTIPQQIVPTSALTPPGSTTPPAPSTTTTTTTTTTSTSTSTTTSTSTSTASSVPTIAGCAVFPADNPWNQDVSGLPLDPNSGAYMSNIAANGAGNLHPDFGANLGYGIPFVVVPGSQSLVPVSFDWPDESDPGPYPIPANAPIENGASSTGDRHVIALDKDHCKVYEMYLSYYQNPGWHCGSGAVFDLRSNALRPEGWTSADAAGLPILPGLVRYDEIAAGEIKHALRFTVRHTQRAHIHPATHSASSATESSAPPLGLRVRLKASYDISGYSGAAKVILVAMKKYGMLLADNGSNWYFSGTSDTRFDDNNLNTLKNVPGSAFEVVKTGAIIKP